jgi:predicted oxidoreductase
MQPQPHIGQFFPRLVAYSLLLLALGSCTQMQTRPDADVLVVGAGIAGLSAALEAAAEGARVVVLESNSVGGGHAVRAGGLALVDTALQRSKGIEDSPVLAFRDLLRWGEDPDPYWTRYYVENSAAEVYDWLAAMGVEFTVLLKTPQDSVPRFHFTRGTAVNVVLPMLRKALLEPNIRFVWNTEVTAIAKARGQITGVFSVNERDGSLKEWRATTTVLATGGFQNNLGMVRDNWPADQKPPARIYQGAGHFANGDGHRLARWAGGQVQDMDRQVTFYSGVPHPDDPTGSRGLYTENPAAIWLADNGRRFMNESADSKEVAARVAALDNASYWLVFDSRGSRRLNVRDALAVNRQYRRDEILANPEITHQANSITQLARQTGISPHGMRTSVETWNRMVAVGTDFQHDRFAPDNKPTHIAAIKQPPYYAIRVYPLTRKSMGGPVTDLRAQVVDKTNQVIGGLYAAGELTGVAGINGSFGGAGTFLGPSVLTGRLAGQSAARDALAIGRAAAYQKPAKPPRRQSREAPEFGLPGFWHYDAVHRMASDKAYTCDRCHSGPQMKMADKPRDMLARLSTCTGCH